MTWQTPIGLLATADCARGTAAVELRTDTLHGPTVEADVLWKFGRVIRTEVVLTRLRLRLRALGVLSFDAHDTRLPGDCSNSQPDARIALIRSSATLRSQARQ